MKLLPVDAPVLLFIGPSGTGKSTIIRRLVELGIIELTPTWTDRPRRADEEALEHVFVSSKELDAKATAGYFLHEPIYLFNLPYRYASPKIPLPAHAKVPALMSRVMAMGLADKLYPNRIVYQIEAPKELVTERLLAREKQAKLGTRLKDFDKEVTDGRQYAKRVFENDTAVEDIVQKIKQAIITDFDYHSG